MQHALRTNFILIFQMNQKHFFVLINKSDFIKSNE